MSTVQLFSLLLGLVTLVNARFTTTGDLTIPSTAAHPVSTTAMPAGCIESASNIASRWLLPQTPSVWTNTTTSRLKWGPDLNVYPAVNISEIPVTCNPTAWAWKRLNQTIYDTLALGINYCHHHAPNYDTPASVQVVCNPTDPGVDTAGCVCNAAGMNRTYPWRGVDCSNLSAFLYNFAFGFYPTSSIGEQACNPSVAPGRLLDVNTSRLNLLLPGDLLYITLSRTGRTAPVRVSHVVVWTNLTVDFTVGATGPLSKAALMANVPSSMTSSVTSCMTKRQTAKLPVYVIADSSNNGPSFRPFCGWYMTSFSHARRVIDPAPSLPIYNSSVAYWNDTSGDCMSMWALSSATSYL